MNGKILIGNAKNSLEAVEPTADTLAKRNSSGALKGATATTDSELVNLAQLNTALSGKLDTTLKGASNGLAELDENGKVPSTQLPSFVDDIIEVATYEDLPETGESSKIYVTIDTNLAYRWGGSEYTEISQSLALGETSATASRGDWGKTAYDHSQTTSGNPHSTTKSDVGLGNVPNPTTYGGIAIAENLNTINFSGFYTCYGSATGAPNADYSWFITHQNSNVSTASATQRAVAYNTELIIYERIKLDSTWGNWINISSLYINEEYERVKLNPASRVLKIKATANVAFNLYLESGSDKDTTIYWGDDEKEIISSWGTKQHTYANTGFYEIVVVSNTGTLTNMPQMYVNNQADKNLYYEVSESNLLTLIGNFAYYKCSNLILKSNLQNISITSWAFDGCSNFKSITVSDDIDTLSANSFSNCTNLTTLVIPATTPPTMGTDALANTGITPSTGFIYVPFGSVSAYKSDDDWSTYADRIFPIVDGDVIEAKEDNANKVTSISSESTDTQYPSAKCVYDIVGDIETLLGGI